MVRRSDKDLFEETTMSFGEHLEELRTRLFRAIIGLIAGVVIGLYFGNSVAWFIRQPLEKALRSYYQDQSLKRAEARLTELQAAGKILPAEPTQLARMVSEAEILPEQVFLDPVEVAQQLKQRYPQQFGTLQIERDSKKELGRNDLLEMFIWRPLEDDLRVRVKSLSAHEAFAIYMKASLLVGAVVASPWVFYQLWLFVAAGLYKHERRYVHVFLPCSLGLFLLGVALAFFFVFQPVLHFLFSFNRSMGIEPDPRISEWISFVLMLPLGFGIGFQLPLVMLFLERIGLFTHQQYLAQWRLSILVIAVVAMVITPPDPYSMLLMVGPLTALYFGGIALCKFFPRMPSRPKELDDAGF